MSGFPQPVKSPLTIQFGATVGAAPFTIKDAAGDTLVQVQKGAASGATFGSLFVPGGDILNMINIQGGFTGVTFNLNITAGQDTAGNRGNVELQFGLGANNTGGGVAIWNGGSTAFTNDATPGSLIAKFNWTPDGTAQDGTIKFYLPFTSFGVTATKNNTLDDGSGNASFGGIVSSIVGGVAAVWNAAGAGAGHQWKTNNTTEIMGLDNVGNLQTAGRHYPGSETLALQTSGGILHSTGIPSNANGSNNDWCISDNGHLYFKSAGSWVQKV